MKSQLIRKDPGAGKDQGQQEKGMTENEMMAQHHHTKNMTLSKLREMVEDWEAWRAAAHGVANGGT